MLWLSITMVMIMKNQMPNGLSKIAEAEQDRAILRNKHKGSEKTKRYSFQKYRFYKTKWTQSNQSRQRKQNSGVLMCEKSILEAAKSLRVPQPVFFFYKIRPC